MGRRALRPDHDVVARILPTAALAAACAASALAGCGFTAVKDEPVTLVSVSGAYVFSGSERHVARDGEHLRKGDLVRTAPGGAATLVVRDRRVLLAAESDVTVPDGATVELGKGALLVDRRRGPGLTVRIGDTTVDQITSGAVRVEHSLSVSVAALSARVRVRTASGVRRTVPALYQLGVAGRALPEAAAPLQLRDDAWERGVVPDLVADDVRLNDLADGFDAPGSDLPAAYRPTPGARASDRLLADAIGRAAGRDDAARRKAADRAAALRAQGGSWGVVAAIVRTRAVAVGTALADVLRAGVPTVAPKPGASTPPDGIFPGPSPQPGVTPTPIPSPSRSSRSPKPPTQSPSPTSSPSSESVVDQIGKIIQTPSIGVGVPPLGIRQP